jgi:hypothetical protein
VLRSNDVSALIPDPKKAPSSSSEPPVDAAKAPIKKADNNPENAIDAFLDEEDQVASPAPTTASPSSVTPTTDDEIEAKRADEAAKAVAALLTVAGEKLQVLQEANSEAESAIKHVEAFGASEAEKLISEREALAALMAAIPKTSQTVIDAAQEKVTAAEQAIQKSQSDVDSSVAKAASATLAAISAIAKANYSAMTENKIIEEQSSAAWQAAEKAKATNGGKPDEALEAKAALLDKQAGNASAAHDSAREMAKEGAGAVKIARQRETDLKQQKEDLLTAARPVTANSSATAAATSDTAVASSSPSAQAAQLQNLTNSMAQGTRQTVSYGPPYRPSTSVSPHTVTKTTTKTTAQTPAIFKEYCDELSNMLGDKTPLLENKRSFSIPRHKIAVEHLPENLIQTTISTNNLEEIKKIMPAVLDANKKAGVTSISPNGSAEVVEYIITEMLKRDLTPTFDEVTKKDLRSRGLDVDKFIEQIKPTISADATIDTSLKVVKPS